MVRSLIVVDFPAPFGPKNPKICPVLTDKTISSTALTEPYSFDKWFTLMHDILKLLYSY